MVLVKLCPVISLQASLGVIPGLLLNGTSSDVLPLLLRRWATPGCFHAVTVFGETPSRESRPGSLCVFYPGSNNQTSWNMQHQHLFYLLLPFQERAEQALMIFMTAFSLQTCLDWHFLVCRLTTTHLRARTEAVYTVYSVYSELLIQSPNTLHPFNWLCNLWNIKYL